MSVSVVIPVRDGGVNFRRCLDALRRTQPAPVEAIVVVDGVDDESRRLAEQFDVRIIQLPETVGPARARNVGARGAVGDVLFFVDADVAVHPDAVARVAAAFDRDPELAAVFGSYDDAPGEPNFLSQYKNLLHHYVHQTGAENASTFWAGCGAVRRSVFIEVGGFDERFDRPSIEDIELGYRLRRAGYRICLCKDLRGTHWKRWGPLSLLRSDFFDRALPWAALMRREGRILNDLNLKLGSRASGILSWILVATLAAAFWRRGALVAAALVAGALFLLNLPVYRFFKRKRGLRFAARVVPWHWLYYMYSALAFSLCAIGFYRVPERAGRERKRDDP